MDTQLRLALHAFASNQTPETAYNAAMAALRAEGSASSLSIEGVLTVSNSHLSAREREILGWLVVPHFPHHLETPSGRLGGERYWLYCPSLTKTPPRGGLPMIYRESEYVNVRNLVDIAIEQSCAWLRIIPDGPIIANLRLFP